MEFGDIYDDVAGAADDLAGQTDETVAFIDENLGQTASTTDTDAILDAAAGSTDEWVGEQTSNLYDGAAGAADHLAGSTDEWVGRTFDDQTGGGIQETAQNAADTSAGVLDFLAGSTDEWVGQNPMQSKLILALVALGALGYVFRPAMQAGANATN